MKPASYYARTEKGAAEVAQRSQAIPARARSLLLMIDGKSTGAQLLEKLAAFPNSGELLQLLETEGYIGPVDGGGAAVSAPAAAPASTASVTAAPAAASPAVASPGTGSVSGIGAAKRFMIRSLHEIFGPDADSLTGKVDLAQTTEDLRKLAEKHRELMASMGSRRKADAYWQGIEELLPAP
ncbi:MAG: hypothetical protein WCF11_14110 [Azonexus sp.]|jgi:hypothetical protein|nr:hypothetical protein [Azonexus sp.]